MKADQQLVRTVDVHDRVGNVVGSKDVVLYAGLLNQAHEEGLLKVCTSILQIPTEENGRLAQCLAAVADLSNDRGYEERARAYLAAAAEPAAIRVQGRIVGDFLLGASLVTHPRAVAHVIGPADDPRSDALFEAALRSADLRVQLERVLPGEGRYPYPGEPSMFACGLDACAAPVTDPDGVAPAIASLLE